MITGLSPGASVSSGAVWLSSVSAPGQFERGLRLDLALRLGSDGALRAKDRGGDRDGREDQAEGDPEGQVVALGQGDRDRAVPGDQRAGPGRGDGGQYGEPERAADLGGGVH